MDLALGKRLPLEGEERGNDSGGADDEVSSGSSLNSIGSIKEVDFRLDSIATGLDSLYKLASRIRNPQTRQQRPIEDLYKYIPEKERAEYIQNQEHIDVSVVMYIQRQHLLECFEKDQPQVSGFNHEDLIIQYASANHWLIRRAGMANARRKQQLLYWKRHTKILANNKTEEAPVVARQIADNTALPLPDTGTSRGSKPVPQKSIATSATKADLKGIGPEDMKSVISHNSRVSTVVSPHGEAIIWPPAPDNVAAGTHFPCPYCGYLCPQRYLKGDNWR